MNTLSTDDLRREVDEARHRLEELESRLRAAERRDWERIWFPQGFYTAYYVLSGALMGIIASWFTLLLNMAGAALLGESPLKLLRVYSTMLGGAGAAQSADAVVLVFALGLHTLTGAVCGAPIHVVYSRFFMGRPLAFRLATGIALGAVMWIVNFHGVLAWLQPLLLGEKESFIVANVPRWVALATHVAFTVSILLLQPFGVFNAKNYPLIGQAASEGEA